ncbi:rCG41608 [Rattus norvegicus]|uniref:RCG41608 n=1 Tax=Rattus norvegicus TaxID=10116 RepID=A6II52_RAT|nr:rCG41608 [Rattus norvegicus]
MNAQRKLQISFYLKKLNCRSYLCPVNHQVHSETRQLQRVS